jgi:hypothetical protein
MTRKLAFKLALRSMKLSPSPQPCRDFYRSQLSSADEKQFPRLKTEFYVSCVRKKEAMTKSYACEIG